MDSREIFKRYFTLYVKRPGVESLLKMLDRTDFYEAPASYKCHLAIKGGLLQHSLNTLYELVRQIKLRGLSNIELQTFLNRFGALEEFSDQDFIKCNELLSKELGSDVSLSSLVIVALCHNFDKIRKYKKYSKNVKDENGSWIQVESYCLNEDCFILGEPGTNSRYIVDSCIRLTLDEALAIENCTGLTEKGFTLTSASSAWSTSKLALYLHVADMIATYNTDRSK